MRRSTVPLPASLLVIVLFLFAPRPARAQSAGVNQGGSPYIHAPADSSPVIPTSAGPSSVEKMRAAERRRRLLADATKLAQLSAELKAVVEQTSPDQLSLDVTRRAAELEKLARDLKQWSTN